MAGMYDAAADVLGVRGEPVPETGFSASEAVNFLTGPPEKDPRWVPDSPPPREASEEPPTRSLAERIVRQQVGGLEALGTLATGTVAAPVGAAAGLVKGLFGGKYGTPQGAREAQAYAGEVSQALTYQPRMEEGQEAIGDFAKKFDASKLAGLGPSEGVSLAGVMAGPTVARPNMRPQLRAVPQQMASVGAAGATPAEQVANLASRASPEVQALVQKVGAGKVNPAVLERVVEGESLPVPVRLTRGQATQDPGFISTEQNLRGKQEQIRNRFTEQNNALIENTNAIRDKAAPDVYATTNPEIGQLVIDAYTAKDAAKNAQVTKAYQALRDANGGAFPVDGVAMVDAADKALHKGLLFDHVPPAVRKTLDRLRDGQSMTFENFESLRTNLARIQRSHTADGNEKAAAGVIRTAMEELPMPAGAEHLKPLADAARQAARERFAAIEADPAYKAVVGGKASADKFIDKFVISADLKNVDTMKKALAHDPAAQQALAAGTINHLKRNAGIVDNAGNFSQAGYNKALENLRPKLGVIFEPEQRIQVETLGRVARYTQAQPRGSYVNTSNTMTAALAEHAKGGAEIAGNAVVPGFNLGSIARRFGGRYMENRELENVLQPGAGIRLKDIAR